MVFSSLLFLFYFLAPVLIIYSLVPQKYKNLTLFISSLIFYSWGEPTYVILMIFSAVFNYICGFIINSKRSKSAMVFNCAVNIGLLLVFKYTDFFISTVNSVIRTNFPLLNLALPIGISFYTFQAMSYCIDVYRGKTKVQRSFVSFGLYLSFFPQLIAGPIVRYDDIANQLPKHPQKVTLFYEGIQRFVAGLAKKVLIANNIGQLWEITVAGETGGMLGAWLGITAYTMQIYYDFSGYSDMAIGLGKMFGFEFCENFNYPYISKSITEFWRRWHISLSSWFKEYVYIPLGGSRIYESDYSTTTKWCGITFTPAKKAALKRNLNILIVWMLTGFWHGASFNFIAWGLYYGLLLILEKKYLMDKLEKTPSFIRGIYTMVIVIVGWVFFASPDFKTAFIYLGSMINIFKFGITNNVFLYRFFSYLPVLLAAIIGCSPNAKKIFMKITEKKLYWIRGFLSIVLLFVCLAYLVDDTYNPFLYFRF
ncbi:MAG: MBOAT family protein [Clostridia bacterium]|nr:MBOAT family protein [Clostridia bacterium]